MPPRVCSGAEVGMLVKDQLGTGLWQTSEPFSPAVPPLPPVLAM